MISMTDTLAGLGKDEKITLTLYFTSDLKKMGISGADQTEDYIRNAYNSVNKQNLDRLDFKVINPTGADADAFAQKYGIQTISYSDINGNAAKAALGLVLEHGDKFYTLPISIQRSFFGWAIAGLDDMEATLTEGLQSLLSNTKAIGYITGHGEVDHTSADYAGNLANLLSDRYELKDIDLNSDDIPAGLNAIIINGPKNDFTEEELYKVDQFLLRGGNVMLFLDGVVENPQVQSYGGYGENYLPNQINIERLLSKYGVEHGKDVVMDKNCLRDMNRQYGELNYYWVPTLHKKQLAKKHPVTNNLGYVYFIQSSSLDPSAAKSNKNIKLTELAKSSEEAWAVEKGIMLHPLYLAPPADTSDFKAYDLAVLLEGKFDSAFDEAPSTENSSENNEEKGDTNASNLVASNYVKSSLLPGKLFVAGSSVITTGQVIDENAQTPIAMFILNVIDYMNGNEDLCTMRTKSLSINNLTIKSPVAANIWKYFNQYGLAVLVAVAGFIVWRLRTARRRAINKKYNPDDTRTITK
jgi:hypothetical protein